MGTRYECLIYAHGSIANRVTFNNQNADKRQQRQRRCQRRSRGI